MSKTRHRAKPRVLSCACDAGPRLIFACSGSSEVGELADRAARVLSKNGVGSMFCLAGVSGHKDGGMESTRRAEKILVIDGCPADCAANALRRDGITRFEHLRLCGAGRVDDEIVFCDVDLQRIVEKGRALLEGWATEQAAPIEPEASNEIPVR